MTYQRNLLPAVRVALADSPVVILIGARQVGKSTLAHDVMSSGGPGRYLTLDEPAVLAAATSDPAGFIGGLHEATVIDEVQRAPGLFRAIKATVDRDRSPGRFLLTGSADPLLLPGLAQELTGRMQVLTLWPLSQGEIAGVVEDFIDAAFGSGAITPLSVQADGRPVAARIVVGGFPEAAARPTAPRRDSWFESYVATVVLREVRELSSIEGLTALPRLLALLAARTSTLLNLAELSRTSGLPRTTLDRYLALLEATFLLRPIPAWAGSFSGRLAKAAKVLLADAGLTAFLVGADQTRLEDGNVLGPLLESFVAMEIRKQLGWSQIRPSLFHFRSHEGREVDLTLEDRSGRLVGIEVKASRTVRGDDFRGLRTLEAARPSRFVRGILLYLGDEVVSFGDRLIAVPMQRLWG